MSSLRTARTETLEVAFLHEGAEAGWPVVLTHGFPYDVHAFDEVVSHLARAGARVIVPYLRGFGPTRFLSSNTMRSGQQAALGQDLIDLLDALGIERAILAGYDWGGVASCVASALWPERVTGLVSYAGYDIVDVERLGHAFAPAMEREIWYQSLFQLERGRECLTLHRRELCRALWERWSPGWTFEESTFERTATSFDNPDFVDVVVHAYRFCFGTAAGDPALASFEARLAKKPTIGVPTLTLDGLRDPLKPGGTAHHASMFSARHEHRAVDCGHNLPWEAPHDFADAILTVRGWIG
ncbi:alpha/beta hydrolase [Inquilinus sp.]|uniref:alpha/beta fold hydrolase n=1 Tax=Inquilinus sp. TaxID=1932117 RepID=UPI0031D92AC4